MRLICGLVRLDGTVASASLLGRMVAQMEPPGLRPTRASFCDGAVAIAVLDFSARPDRSLPVSGSAVIAADVRLDEPSELAQELGLEAPDQGKLLLEILRRRGSPEPALGDFAYAAWDRKTEILTCGRDIFGIRPFSYTHKPGELFAFASAPAALYGSGIVPKAIDSNVVTRRAMRAWRFEDSPVKDIARLPPGHVMEVSRTGIALRRYWQFDRERIGTARISEAEAAIEMRRLVQQAVRSRLPRTARIGSHLSGGLDSSAIAILAARALREEDRKLHAYSFIDRLRNDIQVENEAEFVRACVEQEGDIDCQTIRNSPREFEKDYSLDLDLMHPLAPENPEMQVAATAERQGVDLILSGWGGDEAATFNGRGAMAELFKRGRWRSLKREIAALATERGWTRRSAILHEVGHYWVAEHVPQSLRKIARRLRGTAPEQKHLFQDLLSLKARQAQRSAASLSLAGDGRENRWRLITSPHIAHRAEVWAQIGARHGLAYAFPLLDRRVVEFALSLPSEYFLSGGVKRRPFRDAMRDVLPEKVRQRHVKYEAFPSRNIDMAEARDTFLARLRDYEADPAVRAVLDLDEIARRIDQFPTADAVRADLARGDDPKGRDVMSTVSRAMELADYLQQHGSPHRS